MNRSKKLRFNEKSIPKSQLILTVSKRIESYNSTAVW